MDLAGASNGVVPEPSETTKYARLRGLLFFIGFGGLLGGSELALVGTLGVLMDLPPPDVADYPTVGWAGLTLFAIGLSCMVSFAILPAYEAAVAARSVDPHNPRSGAR